MQLQIDEAYLPVTLTGSLMTDEEFTTFCAQYPDHMVETTAEGEVLIMPPTDPVSSGKLIEVARQLANWARTKSGGMATESSGGFKLPNGARRAPDAAWISTRRLQLLPVVAPDFVIEVRSPYDSLRKLRMKMAEWIENGTELAWLLDPERKAIEIYRPGCDVEIREGVENVKGEGPVAGFTLDLDSVWDASRS